jgi:hypothetical protein
MAASYWCYSARAGSPYFAPAGAADALVDITAARRYLESPGYSWSANIAGIHEFCAGNSIIFVDTWRQPRRFAVRACSFGRQLR